MKTDNVDDHLIVDTQSNDTWSTWQDHRWFVPTRYGPNSYRQTTGTNTISSDTIHPKEVTHKPRVQWVVRIKSYDQYQLQSGQSYAVLSFLDYPFDPLDYSTISGIISIRTGICAFLAYLGRRLLSVTTGISALNSVVSMLSTIVSSISAGTIALLAIVILAIDPSTPPMMSE